MVGLWDSCVSSFMFISFSRTFPFVAIGGIDENNAREVLKAGATRVAVVRAVVGSDNITEAARLLKGVLKS